MTVSPGVRDSGCAGKSGRADLPAPRNDVEVFMTQFSFAAPRNDGIG